MPTTYTETPDNFNEIGTFVEKEINGIKKIFYLAQRVIFYDACSFQKHSHLPDKEIKVLMNYYKIHGTVVFITKCILMELASDRPDCSCKQNIIYSHLPQLWLSCDPDTKRQIPR